MPSLPAGKSATSPMMRQYWQIKSEHPDKLLFFRLGDFYELFYDDAVIASRELELTLTARENKYERIPMCGVPHHAVETYLTRLINRGYKVAICEQVEDPRQSKGLVRREVVQVVTPGTLAESGLIGSKGHRYLTALAVYGADAWSLAATDVLTGQCLVTDFSGPNAKEQVINELQRLAAVECLVPEKIASELEPVVDRWTTITPVPEHYTDATAAGERVTGQYGDGVARSLLRHGGPAAIMAVGTLLAYLEATQRRAMLHLQPPRYYKLNDYLVLDAAARRHLELTRRWVEGQQSKEDTLFDVLDQTQTSMGSRLLQSWIEQPLLDTSEITQRLDAVEALINNVVARNEIRQALRKVYDLERLAGRIALGTANARELLALSRSLQQLPVIKQQCSTIAAGVLSSALRRLDLLTDVRDLLDRALVDDPPATVTEGGLIKDGFNAEVDQLRAAARHGKQWLAQLEQRERERTGIKSLKIGYNRVFGYYIEVTHANRHLVPPDYERRQTLVNAERYVTPQLKEMEEKILGAEERLVDLEYRLFVELRRQVAQQISRIQSTAAAVAEIDVLAALAEVAVRHGYCRPALHNDLRLKIVNGRHPVLETKPEINFVPNDTDLDGDAKCIAIITGPNMGGKSTYLRQVALIVIMAQMGSFVPADHAEIGIVDRIFTRIGAADELSQGRSTFRVEIDEALQVLLFGTRRSLAIIDELGRGTGTFDGIAFSTAYLEYLHRHLRCRTLVSTHFFELTSLAERLPGVHNLHAAATMIDDKLVFSYKISQGAADRSYGIEVAQAAGMPGELVQRARQLLASLETPAGGEAAVASDGTVAPAPVTPPDPPPAANDEVRQLLKTLSEVDIMQLTPLEAMARLHELSNSAAVILSRDNTCQ